MGYKKPTTDLALYRAVCVLYGLLSRGPLPRPETLARMAALGFGHGTTQLAAAALEVPVGPPGVVHTWHLPLRSLEPVLARITRQGRRVVPQARQQRQAAASVAASIRDTERKQQRAAEERRCIEAAAQRQFTRTQRQLSKTVDDALKRYRWTPLPPRDDSEAPAARKQAAYSRG